MYRTKKSFITSLLVLNGFLLFAYRIPDGSYFPGHDFLDHLYVLYKLRGENPHFFDYSANLFGVLGSIPLSALGISDFSLDANLYVLFDAPIAAVINEFISRNLAFLGMYFFLQKLIPVIKSNYVLIAPSLLYAMLPYYPNFELTIAFLPVVAYVVLTSLSERLNPLKILLLLLASLVGNFTYGGFAVLAVVFVFIFVQLFKREFRSSIRLLTIFLVLTSGYLVGISRLLFLKFGTEFHSHRLSWRPSPDRWFDFSCLPRLVSEFVGISSRGYYHFPSGQSIFTNLFIPGMPLVILLVYLGMQAKILSRKNSAPANDQGERRLIITLLCSILVVNLFYASEASGFTHFENLMQEPFQFKRVAVLLPFLWCVVAGLSLHSLTKYFRQIALFCLIFVLAQITVSNFGVQKQILNYVGISGSHLTINEYFDSEAYSGLARKLGRQPSDIRVLSFDLDPMVASLNGYDALDGYVYNYPLEYKGDFRRIIAGELASDSSLRDYYDDWGSRVYLFHRDLPVSQVKLDWCAAQKMGVDFILAKVDLGTVSNLSLVKDYRNLALYKISGC